MVNTRQLEKKWYKYKIKKIFSVLALLLFLILLPLGAYYSYTQYVEKKNKSAFEEKEVLKNIKPINQVMKTENINKIEPIERVELPKKEGVSLEPVIPIIDMEKEERKKSNVISHKKHHVVSRKKTHPTSHKKSTSKHVKAKRSAYLTKNELVKNKNKLVKNNNVLDSRKLKKINMTTTSVNYIETIKKKFISTKKPREALLLAKAYYAKGAYSKAEEWALRANKLNSTSDDSWLLFAKSKAKLGKRDEALKILISYYRKSHSSKVKALIEKIKAGRL